MSGLYNRHGLAWLNLNGWDEALAHAADAHHAAVHQWREQDRPLVVRRRDVGCADDEVCLGIALPPDDDGIKLRVPVRVARSGVREMRAPLTIAEVVGHAPVAWQSALTAMQTDARGLQFCVYGSLALQVLTGQSYLRAASDIDMLFTPRDRAELRQGLALLRHYSGRLPLDGEIVFPEDVAVSWKEWAQVSDGADNHVLTKRRSDVALVRAGDLSATLEETVCPA